MGFLLMLLSLVIIFMGVALLWKPGEDGVLGVVRMYVHEVGLQVFASVGRILIGMALLAYASSSNLPGVLKVLGWLSVLSGLVFLFMPHPMFRNFMTTMIDKLQEFGKIVGAVVIVIGGLLLDAVW